MKIKSIDDLLGNFFSEASYGTPENITKLGCLELAKLGADAWNLWRRNFPSRPYGHFYYENISDFSGTDFTGHRWIDFSGFCFGDGANFSYCVWERNADFFCSEWGDFCKFLGTSWGVRGYFSLARWGDNCDFRGGDWGHDCVFEKSHFGNNQDFSNTLWRERIHFNEASFGRRCNFNFSIWQGVVSFQGSGASGLSNYTMLNAKNDRTPIILESYSKNSMGDISFKGAKFLDEVYFDDRRFIGSADFSSYSTIENIRIIERDEKGCVKLAEGEIFFKPDVVKEDGETLFSKVPSFHEVIFHMNTSFSGAIFPEPTGQESAVKAYRTMKLAFDRLQSEDDAKFFKRLEIIEGIEYKKINPGNMEYSTKYLGFVDMRQSKLNISNLFEVLKLERREELVCLIDLVDDYLISSRWGDAISNSRKFFENTLLIFSLYILSDLKLPNSSFDPKRPVEIRKFLCKEKIITKKELELASHIYGFLSETGAHNGSATEFQAGLAVKVSMAFVEFLLVNFCRSRNI